MDNNLFKNDRIVGNSLIGLDFKGRFNCNENILLTNLKDVLNREITFSNVGYKLLEPTNNTAVLIYDNGYYEIKTPMYTYYEAMFILPRVLEFMKNVKNYKNSYLYFRLGFNESFCNVSQLNVGKFILEFNEDAVLKGINDSSSDENLEKLTDIKPISLEGCEDTIQKQLNSLKTTDTEDIYGINFNTLQLGYITFKYAKNINYRSKWDEILKSLNHTLITLYNTSIDPNFTDDETKKLETLNKSYKDTLESFGCYELFKNKYSKIKLTKDLNPDITEVNLIFPSIKDKLFDLVVRNEIKEAEVNYDSDISRLQIKNLDLKKCYHISGLDIVDCDIDDCFIRDCDIYDTKIEKSSLSKCNLFGYANCKDSNFRDCFVSGNIKLTDCNVSGTLGKMAGTMKGGSLRDTTVIKTTADIDSDVEKDNVNEIQ